MKLVRKLEEGALYACTEMGHEVIVLDEWLRELPGRGHRALSLAGADSSLYARAGSGRAQGED